MKSGLGDIKGAAESCDQSFLDFWFKGYSGNETSYKPLISINETDKEIYVKAVLPEIKSSSDISVKLCGNILIICGGKGSASFKRTIHLPVPCDEKNAVASLRTGLFQCVF